MAELKVGGNDVKIMYGDQEIGGATKLEPGTILYINVKGTTSIKDAHLFSTTKKWENINGINIALVDNNDASSVLDNINISSDDFKNLDTEKEYTSNFIEVTVSRSIVDGEYRLNVSGFNQYNVFAIKAI